MQRMMQSLKWLPRVKVIVGGNRVITACKASLRNQLEAPLPAMTPPVTSVVKTYGKETGAAWIGEDVKLPNGTMLRIDYRQQKSSRVHR